MTDNGIRSQLAILKEVGRLVLPYRKRLVAAIVLYCLSTASAMLIPLLAAYIIDDLVPAARISAINVVIGIVVLITVMTICLAFTREILLTVFSSTILADLRRTLYRTIIGLPYDTIKKWGVGYWISRVDSDVAGVSFLSGNTLVGIVEDAISLLVGAAFMLAIYPKLAVMVLSIVPALFMLTIYLLRSIDRHALRNREMWARYLGALESDIRNGLFIKAFSIADRRERIALKRLDAALHAEISLNVKNRSISNLLSLVGLFIPVLILWVGLTDVALKRTTLGIFIAFNAYAGYVTAPVGRLVEAYRLFRTSSASYKRIQEICEFSPEEKSGQVDVTPLVNHIVVRNVSHSYNGRECSLRDVDLSIKRGKKVAVIGPNGSGKSTLLLCMAKFIEPQRGMIYYDSIPYSDISPQSLRKQMAFVADDSALWEGSVLGNIRCANPMATREEIESLLERLGFFNGTDWDGNILFRRTADLAKGISDGQRQIIGLARAILRRPQILIVDEGISNLDHDNRARAVSMIHSELADSTVLWSIHDLSAAEMCDEIVYMNMGRIIDVASHGEQLKDCNWYTQR